LATLACELTEYRQSHTLNTLATAYAAVGYSGYFIESVNIAEKAVYLVRSGGQTELMIQTPEIMEWFRRVFHITNIVSQRAISKSTGGI